MMRARWAVLLVGAVAACSSGGNKPVDGGVAVNPETVAPIDVSQWNGIDAGALDFLVELNKARRGESADLDGDGLRELTVFRRADGTQVWVLENNGPVPAFMVEQFPDGHRKLQFWYSNFATPVLIEEVYADKRVSLFDDNHDLKYEKRVTETWPDDENVQAIEEADAGTTWAETRRWTRPLEADQGSSGCSGLSNFNAADESPPSMPAFSNQTAVECSEDQKKKLGRALDCAKNRLDCLGRSNPVVASQLKAQLATNDLYIGCGNPCANKLATTRRGFLGGPGRMNFNGTRLNTWDDPDTCTILMHEMMHAADVHQDDMHDMGKDTIYSCSRYCGGCTHVGPFGAGNPAPSSNEDCARCAASESERRKCGVKRDLEGGACSTNAICHGTLGTNLACSTCENLQEKDCLGSKIGAPFFNCCQSCPATAMRLNDKPCPGPLKASDTCMMKPPECP